MKFGAATLDMQSVGKVVNHPDPSSAQDVATKAYVDAVAVGLVVKPSAVVVATTNLTLSGTQTIDGVAVAANQRVLAVGQSTASQNGPWIVGAGGWARPTDFASGSSQNGDFVFIESGTVGTGAGYTLTGATAASPVVVDTTAQTWTQFSGAGEISVTSPIAKSGNTLSLGTVPINLGGTNATTAAAARTNLAVPGKFAANIGDGSTTAINVAHNLNTTDVVVQVYLISSKALTFTDIAYVDANNVTVTFATAPASNAYRVVVIG